MTTGIDPHFHVTVTTPSGVDLLIPIALDVREGLSELFELRLDCLVERQRADEVLDLIGASISVESRAPDSGEQPRYWHGLATHVVATSDNDDYRSVEVVVRPAHWMLTRNRSYNVFNQHSIVQALGKALVGYAVEYQVFDTYPIRNYTVQYGESDFDFACRLMQDHGLFFHFESNAKRTEMIVRDRSPDAAPITGSDEIEYDVQAGGTRDTVRIWGWRTEQELAAAKIVHHDRVFQMPSTRLDDKCDLSESVTAGSRSIPLQCGANRQIEVHEYPGGCAKWFDDVNPSGQDQTDQFNQIFAEHARQARRRSQQRAHECVTIRAESDCSRLIPGFSFRLKGNGTADGAYLLMHVEHSIRLTPPSSQASPSVDRAYVNRFTCLPLSTPYVPPRSVPRPVISGPQTAIVVGAVEDEIFTDKHGRIKVRFPWQGEDASGESNSCWMRVATQSAGKGWGMVTIPRVGQEVVVEFLDGDPDCPLVTGCVFNTERTHPFAMPGGMTGSLIKTQSYHGDADEFHGLLMQDQRGSELFQVRSQKDMLVECKNNHTLTVPNQHVRNVGGDSVSIVGGLSIPVSGSGSDEVGSGSGGADESAWESWQGIDVGDVSFVSSISTTYGLQSSNTLGANLGSRILMKADTTVDPFNVLSTASRMVAPALSSFVSSASAVTSGLLGISTMNHCNEVGVSFGTKTSIISSQSDTMNIADPKSWQSSTWQAAYLSLATIHALAQIAKPIVADALRNDATAQKVVMQALDGMVISLRWAMYWIAYYGIKLKLAADALNAAAASVTYYSTVLVTAGPAANVVLNAATAQVAGATDILETTPANMTRSVPGAYAIRCGNYSLNTSDANGLLRLQSAYQIQEVADNAIHLQATNGSVNVTANTIQLTNNQGRASAPTIALTDTDVTLAFGNDLKTASSIAMDANGIVFEAVDTSTIVMATNELNLAVGMDGAMIEMSDTELKLSIGSDTWIKLSAAGIEMSGRYTKVSGDTTVELNAPAIYANG